MSHSTYKPPPPHFVLRLRLQNRGRICRTLRYTLLYDTGKGLDIIYTTLYHFLSISLVIYSCLYNNSLHKTCMLYRIVYTKLSYSLLSQCGINWIYYLYSEYKHNILLVEVVYSILGSLCLST